MPNTCSQFLEETPTLLAQLKTLETQISKQHGVATPAQASELKKINTEFAQLFARYEQCVQRSAVGLH